MTTGLAQRAPAGDSEMAGTMNPVNVDRLGPGDWQVLRDVRLAALEDSPHAFWAKLSDECRYGRDKWSSFVSTVAWFVARLDNGDVAGVAGLLEQHESEPEVISMWVVPAERGHGTGARLTLAAVHQAESHGARSVGLWVTDGNTAACRMYQRLGFQFTGEWAPLPHDAAAGERRMRIELGQG
jgi:ribosomal protein S18 acetylase RimI-like enzyme